MKKRKFPINDLMDNIAQLKARAEGSATLEEKEACGREAGQMIVQFLRSSEGRDDVGSGAVLGGALGGAGGLFWAAIFARLERAIRGF